MNENNLVNIWDAHNMRQSLEKLFPNGVLEFVNDANIFKLFCTYEGVTFGVICAIQNNFQSFLHTPNGITMGSITDDKWAALKTSINNAMSFIVDSVCDDCRGFESCKLAPSTDEGLYEPKHEDSFI